MFLKYLLKAYCLYTLIDLEDSANLKAINLAFVAQLAPDIFKKIQRMDELIGKYRS